MSKDDLKKDTKKSLKETTSSKKKKKITYVPIDEVRSYELCFILDSEMTEKNREAKITEIKKIIDSFESKIVFEDYSMGVKQFCYKIKKKWHGLYVIFNLEAKASTIPELNRELELENSILRHLLIKLPEDYKPTNYEVSKEKYEIPEEVEEERPSRKPMPTRKVVKAPEPVVEEKKEVVEEVKEEVKEEKTEEKKEVKKEVKEEKVEEKTETPASEEKKEEKKEEKDDSSKDHLKELNDKLDKLLLSDDLDTL